MFRIELKTFAEAAITTLINLTNHKRLTINGGQHAGHAIQEARELAKVLDRAQLFIDGKPDDGTTPHHFDPDISFMVEDLAEQEQAMSMYEHGLEAG